MEASWSPIMIFYLTKGRSSSNFVVCSHFHFITSMEQKLEYHQPRVSVQCSGFSYLITTASHEEEAQSAQAMLKLWKEQYQSLHTSLRNANLQAKSNIQKAAQEEFIHEEVRKSKLKEEALCGILLGMATEFKKDPVLILRIDGEDLKEFVESTQFEAEAISIFSQLDHADASLHNPYHGFGTTLS